ncbi:intraflagellar transport protein 27 homolog isoform X3 [Syngnathoides biaculeatus]|nr:intraflagellar transport protein 27 homolog isoform X3 [Syngnathoides biaculeatus]XP_061685286.1 intraflagellar transport protein 27 homolog isoform X3 [Syngnathoides biaculeatus]XP_061685287.1 intraflagellar transport protein 27 homolog isoform X3 [Syngnathoides biaculeatus]
MFHSDGALFQKNYSMWEPQSLGGLMRARDVEKRIQQTLETTRVELLIKSVNIPDSGDSVELYIIDSAGKETLVEANEKMWGEPSLVCLVFDLTSENSFASCGRWMERVRTHCRGLNVPGVLVGNKCDLSARREVQTAVAQEWAHSQGLEYHETSAKEMENVEAPLLSLARAFHTLYQERRETIQNLSPG